MTSYKAQQDAREEDFLRHKIEKFPDRVEHQVRYANYLWLQDRDAEALECLNQAMKDFPGDPGCVALKAQILESQGQAGAANEIIEKAEFAEDVSVENLEQAARLANLNEQPHLALVYAELAVKEDPRNDQAKIQQVLALAALTRYSKCIRLGEPLVKRFPEHALLWKSLGQAYSRLGQGKKALECFKTALELEPDDNSLRTSYLGHRGVLIPGASALVKLLVPLQYLLPESWLQPLLIVLGVIPFVLGLFGVVLPGGQWTQLGIILYVTFFILHSTLLNFCHRCGDFLDLEPRLKEKRGRVLGWVSSVMMLISYGVLAGYLVRTYGAEPSAYFVVYPLLMAMTMMNSLMINEQKRLGYMDWLGLAGWVICMLGILVHMVPQLQESGLYEISSWIMYLVTVLPALFILLFYPWWVVSRIFQVRYAQRVKKGYLKRHPGLA